MRKCRIAYGMRSGKIVLRRIDRAEETMLCVTAAPRRLAGRSLTLPSREMESHPSESRDIGRCGRFPSASQAGVRRSHRSRASPFP
jgi:hypothetical protein